jgi:hypothetical protein
LIPFAIFDSAEEIFVHFAKWSKIVMIAACIYGIAACALFVYARFAQRRAEGLAVKLQKIRIGESTRGDVAKILGPFTAAPMGGSYEHQQDGFGVGGPNYPPFLNMLYSTVPFLAPAYPSSFGGGIYFEGDHVADLVVYFVGRGIFVRTVAHNLGGLAPEASQVHWMAGDGVTVNYDQCNSEGARSAWNFNFSCLNSFLGCKQATEILPIAAPTRRTIPSPYGDY